MNQTALPSSIDLSLPRSKPRSLLLSVTFRLARGFARLLGAPRVLGVLLDVEWATRRVAFEMSGDVFSDFHPATSVITDNLLAATLGSGSNVLDVGCGVGRWSAAVARHARTVTAVDHDPVSLVRARRAVPANVEVIHGDVARVLRGQLADRTFDVALLVHVLEHVDEPGSLLRTLRLLAAKLLIELPDFEADALNLPRVALGRPYWWDADHVREYREADLRSELSATGWTIERLDRRWGALLVVAARAGTATVVPA